MEKYNNVQIFITSNGTIIAKFTRYEKTKLCVKTRSHNYKTIYALRRNVEHLNLLLDHIKEWLETEKPNE